MQKILIISYFFPPCNLTAAGRVGSWAEHFHKFGLFPIVITRNWQHEVHMPEDILKPGGKNIIHEKHSNYEVYYLPHNGTLRDKLYLSVQQKPYSFITKPLTAIELIGQNYSAGFTPFLYLKDFAYDLLNKNKDIQRVLISANPFILFKFGYLLKKKFPSINWFADYRDDWNTTELYKKPGLSGIIQRMESMSEKKWLSNARFITSVSEHYTNKISKFTGKPGFTIYNGFDKIIARPPKKNETFTILFNGTLYPTQDIELFCECVKVIINKNPNLPIRLKFPGLGFDPEQERRVRLAMAEYQGILEITERISRDKVIEMQNNAQVLLMIAHQNVKGITSSKLFEYLSLKRPILVYPNDRDILEKIITETQTGQICDSSDDIIRFLQNQIDEFIQCGNTSVNGNTAEISHYSRENQAKSLCELILQV